MLAVGIDRVPADRADAWNKAHVVVDQDEEEDRAEEPEDALGEVVAHQAGKEIIERFDCPFREILHAGGDQRHLAGRGTAEQNDQANGQPDHDHRVGDEVAELGRVERKGVVPFAAAGPEIAEAGQPSGQGNDEFASKHAVSA